MSAEVARVLREAADLLERDGWCRGRVLDEEGRRCGAGAVIAIDSDKSSEALDVLAKVVGTNPIAWNDAQAGPEPVVAALRAAADEAERA